MTKMGMKKCVLISVRDEKVEEIQPKMEYNPMDRALT
jgi:hypothetical protein